MHLIIEICISYNNGVADATESDRIRSERRRRRSERSSLGDAVRMTRHIYDYKYTIKHLGTKGATITLVPNFPFI